MPLPPLEEQIRIVERIATLISIFDLKINGDDGSGLS